jgi:hypothetical protein
MVPPALQHHCIGGTVLVAPRVLVQTQGKIKKIAKVLVF